MPPVPPYFDPALDAWVLSRYADVLAAFRDLRLSTTTVTGKDQTEGRDDAGRLTARNAMQESLAAARVAEWQPLFELAVSRTLAGLPLDRPVDLLREFSQSVCLELAARVTGIAPADVRRMGELGDTAFRGTGAPDGSEVQAAAAAATVELHGYFKGAAFRMGEPTFVGISQTMARLMASGWSALLRFPEECRRLRERPELMPCAVDELLRFAGIVPTLFRRATADVTIGGAKIAAGQRTYLRIAAANRDPEQFPDPDRLDVTRRAASQLALGIGRNSCVGNLVIRMAYAVTTGALLRQFPGARPIGDVLLQESASFCWPASVMVDLSCK